MELACTKKLLEYLGVKVEKASAEIDPLFAWTANLIVVNRRKTLVVVHGTSRCAFVLHGLTVKLLPRLPELILDGVRRMLEIEGVNLAIIEQYLDDLGRNVSFRANASHKGTASCIQVCEHLRQSSALLEPGVLYQRSLVTLLNNARLPEKEYICAYEELIRQLRERYGEGVQSCRALELEVSLMLHTICKRRIIVPDSLNFYQLHNALQRCFGWHNCHLYQFVVEVDAEGYPVKVIQPGWYEMEHLPGVQMYSEEVTVGEVFDSPKRIIYEYDFGDEWIHEIELCRVIENYPKPEPHCIMAVGDAPMENCGGPDGFAYIMRVLNEPKHLEFSEISKWVKTLGWEPPDVEKINRKIQNCCRKKFPDWLD